MGSGVVPLWNGWITEDETTGLVALMEIYLHAYQKHYVLLFNQDLESLYVKLLVTLPWLVKSQRIGNSPTSTAFDAYPQRVIFRDVFGANDISYFLQCFGSDIDRYLHVQKRSCVEEWFKIRREKPFGIA